MSEVELTMIERVAQVIWDVNRPEGAPDFDELDFLDQGRVKQIARACIKEMRIATEEMDQAGYEIDEKGPLAYVKMIDAALKED